MKEEDKWMIWNGIPIDFPVPDGVRLPIYCMGDSHIIVLVECCPGIFRKPSVDLLDAHCSKTAYAIGADGHDHYLNEGLEKIPSGEVVLLSFGEIDTRHYVPRHSREKGIPIEELVSEVMERYTKNCVRLLRERFRVALLGPWICPDDLSHRCDSGGETWMNDYASILEAKTLLNERLEDYAEQNGCLYVPTFKVSMENEWHVDRAHSYFNDTSHLGPCMIPVIFNAMANFRWKGFDY